MKTLIAIVLMGLTAACGGNNLSLSVRAGSGGVTAARNSLTLSNGVVLSRVRIVVRDLKLEKATGNSSDDNDDDEIASGPYLLDLSGATLDGAVGKVLDADFTPGTYKEIKIKIHKLTSSDSFSGNAGLQEMSTAGASVIAEGTINGAAFTYTTDVESKQEFEGNITLASGSNLTLNVDPTNWFSSSGALLDPRNSSNKSQIDDNIKKSFKAFKDDDHDGHDD